MTTPRVLLVAPSDSDAAMLAFAALRPRPELDATLLTDGAGLPPPLGVPLHQPWGEGAFALEAGGREKPGGMGVHPWLHVGVPRHFAALLGRLRPDIVDFHGIPWFGADALAQARRALPDARLVLTLDTAAARHAGTAPAPPSPWEAAARGVTAEPPALPANDAFLRDAFLRRFLAEPDRIVLRGPRLARAWRAQGLPDSRLAILPPPVPATAPAPPAASPLVIGCFAGALDAEGAAVLDTAARALAAAPPACPLRLLLHAAPGEPVPPPPAPGDALLRIPHVPGRGLDAAIAECHAILIPGHSREDPPPLAARALAAGRPVLWAGEACAPLREAQDGFGFTAGSGLALASLLAGLAEAPERLAALRPGAGLPDPVAETLGLYRTLLESPA